MERRNQPKKKSKAPFLIIAGVLVIAAGGGGYYAYSQWSAGQELKVAEAAGKSFLKKLTTSDFDSLGEVIDQDAAKKSGYEIKTVQEKYQTIFSGIGAEGIKSSKVKVTKKSDEVYTFTYQLEMTTALGSLKDLAYETTIEKDQDQYKVEWAPSLIFPDMSGQDKISLDVVQATRGSIQDRTGTGMAINQDFDQVGIVPGKLGTGAERTANIEAFSKQFDISTEDIEQKLAQGWVTDDVFVPITVSYEPITELPTGATTSPVSLRYYPLKEAAAHLIGYTGAVTAEDIEKDPTLSSTGVIGKSGLEQAYDKELRGQDGGSLAITDENGNVKKELQKVEKKDGQTIKLTIDAPTQKTAYDSLASKTGSIVVTDPTQGDLLAAVSSPSYDPNKMANGISQEDYDAYANNKEQPFLARFANRYAPGSTFKTLTGSIGFDAGTLKPDEELPIEGLKWQKDDSWGDYYVTRVKEANPVNLQRALVNSDNIYFAQQTLRMGEKTFRAGLDKFIFGEDLDIAIPMTPAQISNEKSFDSEILLADTGYGQGELLISPIQQAVMYSVFRNGGSLVYPRLTLDQEVKKKDAVISSEAADLIANDLTHSVTDADGYAYNLYNPNYSLAAKTGTAEIKQEQDTTGQENSFLLAMDMTNNKFLMVAMIENSRGNDPAAVVTQPLIEQLEAQ